MSEWQPINTAPKTRSAILVWCEERRNTYIVTWMDGTFGPEGWHHFGDGGFVYECPTHWMRIPSPPTSGAEPK